MEFREDIYLVGVGFGMELGDLWFFLEFHQSLSFQKFRSIFFPQHTENKSFIVLKQLTVKNHTLYNTFS